MIGILLLTAIAGMSARSVRRGWLVIPLSLVIPAVPITLGAADDGEALLTIGIWFALWPAAAALGYATGSVVVRRRSSGLSTAP